MAAVQTPGTPAAAANVAPAGQETSKPIPAGAEAESTTTAEAPALANLPEKLKKARDERKAGKKAEAKPAEKTDDAAGTKEGAEAGAEGEKPKGDVTAEQLFTPEALASEDGIKRARDVVLYAKTELEKSWRKFDRADMRVKARDAKVTEREATADKREQAIETVRNTFGQAMQIIRGQRASNPLQILSTLDYLAGGQGDVEAGRVLAHEMMLAIGRDGKAATESEGEKRLRLQVERLAAEREHERRQHSEAQLDHQIQVAEQTIKRRELEIGNQAVSSGSYPGIAGFVSTGGTTPAAVGNWIANVMEKAYQRGEPLDLAEAFSILDRKLAPYAQGGARAAQAESVGDQTEQVASALPQAKPVARQSTVLPSDADRSIGTSRKESREERRARQARDPELLKRLGPVIANAAGLR